MITLQTMGSYRLVETKHNTKLLYLDDVSYAWVEPLDIGEILVVSYKTHKTDCVLSVGHYRIYGVSDEPDLSDQLHLELETGLQQWQGYLLPTGLPSDTKIRARIIPTTETITGKLAYSKGNKR